MKFVIYFALLCAIISTCVGYETIGQFYTHENPGKCSITRDLILSPGDEVKDPRFPCGKLICVSEKETYSYGCGLDDPKEAGCKWGEPIRPDTMYPHCCEKKLICKK